jgi:hypothetical protein
MGKQINTPIKPSSPRQTWARRRNWEKRVLFGIRGIAEELNFRLNFRYKEFIDEFKNQKFVKRSQTMSDKEIQLMVEILERLVILHDEWNQTNSKLRNTINFSEYK